MEKIAISGSGFGFASSVTFFSLRHEKFLVPFFSFFVVSNFQFIE